jgi:hypothetical protein
MKTFFTMILLSLPLIIFGQKTETYEKLKSYDKEATLIIIVTDDTIDLAYNKIATYVMDYGFALENSDKSLFYFNTKPMLMLDGFKRYSFENKINVRLKQQGNQTKIIIKGEVNNSPYKFPAANLHNKDLVQTICFAQMFEIAEMYENGIFSVEFE